jgi:cobalt-zinc-cadmium efflux system membrane fusion protein
MRNSIYLRLLIAACLALLITACGKEQKVDAASEAPPANVQIEHVGDPGRIKVDHPEQFPVTVAGTYESLGELNVTGSVAADVSKAVPVVSLAAGRVLEVHAKLGDSVTKGQVLMRIQSADISNAFSDYRQAVADETLAKAQLERAKMLLDRGAIAQKDHEVAVDVAAKAHITVENTQERLRLHGADLNHPSSIIDVVAPISGVITDQQVTAAAGVQGLASPNPFTISDLSSVWILCDVYENDLKNVRVGEYASVRLNAYPDQVFQGRVSNIASSLDPALRTARVRLEMKNPGNMRIGMFVTAAFRGTERKTHASVPSSAILHLHDHDWVYVPVEGDGFRRVEVSGGKMLPSNMQEVLSGIAPGDKVVSNALVLQNTSEQ